MTTTPDLVLTPYQGETLQVIEDRLRVLSRGEHTDQSYEMFELTGPLHSGPPPHYHPWSETYYVIEGAVEVLIGTATVRTGPGFCVTIPGGTPHTYRIVSPSARFLVTTSTTAASAFFSELHQALSTGPASLDNMLAIATRHQVTLLGSPDNLSSGS